jgi:hypothetical protein
LPTTTQADFGIPAGSVLPETARKRATQLGREKLSSSTATLARLDVHDQREHVYFDSREPRP